MTNPRPQEPAGRERYVNCSWRCETWLRRPIEQRIALLKSFLPGIEAASRDRDRSPQSRAKEAEAATDYQNELTALERLRRGNHP